MSTVLPRSRATVLARLFRVVAIVEACSWIGLLIGMAFTYPVVALVTARVFRSDPATTVLALLASIPPAATVWFERRAVRRGDLG